MNGYRALSVGIALQSVTFCHAHGFAPHTPQTAQLTQLCLQQVHESPLQDFEPVGLSVDEASGPYPTITMWSRTRLLVMRLSPAERAIESTFSVSLPGTAVFAAALTEWRDGKPVVEYIDSSTQEIREIVFPTGQAAGVRTTVAKGPRWMEAGLSVGAMRMRNGWARARRIADPLADTSAIFLGAPNVPVPAEDLAVPAASVEAIGMLHRRIDQLLHVRSKADEGALVTEAAFPFTTVGFTLQGVETWRASPQPDELRNQLGELDLRYVMATPAIAVGEAVLNTHVALRSGRRVSALWILGSKSARYRTIPGDLSFLGAFQKHRLLVATRSGRPYKLILFRWRWTDQRQSCNHPEAQGGLNDSH